MSNEKINKLTSEELACLLESCAHNSGGNFSTTSNKVGIARNNVTVTVFANAVTNGKDVTYALLREFAYGILSAVEDAEAYQKTMEDLARRRAAAAKADLSTECTSVVYDFLGGAFRVVFEKSGKDRLATVGEYVEESETYSVRARTMTPKAWESVSKEDAEEVIRTYFLEHHIPFPVKPE